MDETRERDAEGESLNLLQVAPYMEAGGSHLQATTEDKERLVDWTQDLREIRQMVEFLVRREWKLDAKADVAVRSLERLEKEHTQQEDDSRTGPKLRSSLSTSGSSTNSSALEKSPQAKSSSSTPALSEVPKSS